MTPERLEELRQMAGAIDGPKSAWIDELIEEVDRLKDQGKTACNLFDDLKASQAEVSKLNLQIRDLRYALESICVVGERGVVEIAHDALMKEYSADKRNDEIKGIKADGTGTTEDRCRRCYPNPGIVMNCAGVHGCYCGCHGSGSIRIRG